MENFEEIKPAAITENFIKLIGSDWMLVTAGQREHFNTMTASWGGVGFLWNKPVVFVFIRPQRYTFGFIEQEPMFTLSFFTEAYRSALQLCGTKSGRDTDKVAETGLTPMVTEKGNIFLKKPNVFWNVRNYTPTIFGRSIFWIKVWRNNGIRQRITIKCM